MEFHARPCRRTIEQIVPELDTARLALSRAMTPDERATLEDEIRLLETEAELALAEAS